MTPIDIPDEMDQFCSQQYALIRGWVLFNEQEKRYMTDRFNNNRHANNLPIMRLKLYQEQVTSRRL